MIITSYRKPRQNFYIARPVCMLNGGWAIIVFTDVQIYIQVEPSSIYNPSPPRMFLSLDLLSEYRNQHSAIGPLYVTSSFSTWIFCRCISGFATDCPCDVWCRGLTTCLLHVGPPFGNRFLNTSWAVGLTYWKVYLHFFFILAYAIMYVMIHHIIFGLIFTS